MLWFFIYEIIKYATHFSTHFLQVLIWLEPQTSHTGIIFAFNDPINLTCIFCYSMSSGTGRTPIIIWTGQNCGSGITYVNSSFCATSSITIHATKPQLQTSSCTASFSPPSSLGSNYDQNSPVFVTPTFSQSQSGINVNCKFHVNGYFFWFLKCFMHSFRCILDNIINLSNLLNGM